MPCLDLALNVVDWENVEERVQECLDSDFLQDLQVSDAQHFLELSFVYHFAEVHTGYFLYQRLYLFEQGKTFFVQGHQKTDATVFFQNGLWQHKRFHVVGHQHEWKAEKNRWEFSGPGHLLNVIKVAIMNLDSGIVFKELLGLLCVFGMEVDADDFGVVWLELWDDFFEWSTGAAADVKEVAFEHGHVVEHLEVSGDG
jgi:hypothetical protein